MGTLWAWLAANAKVVHIGTFHSQKVTHFQESSKWRNLMHGAWNFWALQGLFQNLYLSLPLKGMYIIFWEKTFGEVMKQTTNFGFAYNYNYNQNLVHICIISHNWITITNLVWRSLIFLQEGKSVNLKTMLTNTILNMMMRLLFNKKYFSTK